MIVAPRRRGSVGLIVCVAAVLAGCGAVSDDAQRSSLAALARQTPTPRTYKPPVPRKPVTCDRDRLFDSLRASSALPPPGRMPAGSYMEEIRKRKLVVGVDQNTLRLGYFDREHQVMRGLDIDLVKEVARAIFGTSKDNVEDHIVFKAISTDQRKSVIPLREVDLVASAFSISCDRVQYMYFSSVYYTAQQKLLVLEDSNVDSLSDLRGQEVCATKGSTSIKTLEGTGVVGHPVDLRPDCLVELQQGRVGAITSDDSILFGFKQQDPRTKIVGGCINVERYGMAINRSHPEFVRFVNAVLARLGHAGLERIRHRWLSGLKAPTSGEIARCDRRATRRVAANDAAKLGGRLRATELRERWRGLLIAEGPGAILACDRRCAASTAVIAVGDLLRRARREVPR